MKDTAPRAVALRERFLASVDRIPEAGCWIWLRGLTPKGYGIFRFGYRRKLAHRIAYEYFRGSAEGLHVLHRCDVRCCVNPDHLWLGTNAENVADMMAKGRGRFLKGEEQGRAKITERQAIEIKRSELSPYELAVIYKIAHQTVRAIRRGTTWKHLDISDQAGERYV